MIKPRLFYEFGYTDQDGVPVQKELYIDAYSDGEDIDLGNLLRLEE